MAVRPLPQKVLAPQTGLWSKCGKYGFLLFFLKGILWLLGPWAIYAFQ
jgi:hypothetical protein